MPVIRWSTTISRWCPPWNYWYYVSVSREEHSLKLHPCRHERSLPIAAIHAPFRGVPVTRAAGAARARAHRRLADTNFTNLRTTNTTGLSISCWLYKWQLKPTRIQEKMRQQNVQKIQLCREKIYTVPPIYLWCRKRKWTLIPNKLVGLTSLYELSSK